MDSDKLPAKKNGNAPKRRISALQKAAGPIQEGKDVGSSLDDFIATANQTLTDTDAFKLTSDLNSNNEAKAAREKKDKEEETAALEAAAAQTAAEVARIAAEEAARKVLAEVTRKSAQQMAQLEEKLARAEARASSAELQVRSSRQVRAPRAPTPSFEEGPDFAEGSYSKPFGRLNGDLFRPRRSGVVKGLVIAGVAALVAGGLFLAGNGRLWNQDEETTAAEPKAPVAKVEQAPAPSTAAPAPSVTALPAAAPAAEATASPVPKAEPKIDVKAEPLPAEPEEAPQPKATADPTPPPNAPVVSALAPAPATRPTVTPLPATSDSDAEPAPAGKKSAKKKKAKAGRSSRKAAKKADNGTKPSGGIVDPFAQ